jgi:GTPase SAR1 family protein
MSYPGTHVVMLCFAVDNRESFDNAIHQWLDEVREHCSYAKVVLSGLKCDLRNDEATLQRLKKNEQLPISYEEVCIFPSHRQETALLHISSQPHPTGVLIIIVLRA